MRGMFLAIALLPAAAGAVDVGGRFKLEADAFDAGGRSLEASLGHENSAQVSGQLRLTLQQAWGRWNLDAAWQLDGRHGSAVKRDSALYAAYPSLAPSPNDDFFDWNEMPVDGSATRVEQRVDRLSVSYARQQLVLRLGRQALTWGNGLVFHPMDLVNPFQPVATDTVYKRGTDMAYAQVLLDDGSDIQFVAVPRRDHGGMATDAGRSTGAVLANIAGDRLQWSLLLARDRGDATAGIGASGTLGGSVWNLELVPTRRVGGGVRTSAIANLTYATTFVDRYATLFAEYYRNGFGDGASDYTASDIGSDSRARLARGRTFVTGRDYLALGASWDWTPLVKLEPTLIANLRGGSALFDAQLTWSLSNDTLFKMGLRFPLGGRGTEFGGLEIAPGVGEYLGRPTQVFLRLDTYF